MKKEFVIVNTKQFSYHTDTFKYCENLKSNYNVSYVCLDQGYRKVFEKGVNVFYINDTSFVFLRELKFVFKSLMLIKNKPKNTVVFIVYNRISFLLNLFLFNKKTILDIRTGSINKDFRVRFFEDLILKFNTFFFKKISIISNGLAKKLSINKYFLVPLGSDIISNSKKSYETLRLLYVGTLHNRNIHVIIDSLKLVIDNYPDAIESLDIFGSGSIEEENLINSKIKKYALSKVVSFHGFKPHNSIQQFFDKCNVGLSFIPITPYFNYQPPTKTFEYIMSGLFCIATNTIANKEIIDKYNGILTKDNSKSLADSIIKTYKNRFSLNSYLIQDTLKNQTWNHIINNRLIPLIES